MRVGVVGINAKSSELFLREHLAKATLKVFDSESAGNLCMHALFLSTCHRTEIYFSSEDLAESQSGILQLLRHKIDFPFEHKLYSYFGEDCFKHLAMVVAGLDSMILGESEIQSQVKRAYENALVYRNLPSPLHFLFQKSFKIAKQLRSSSFFPQGKIGLESTIFYLVQQFVEKNSPVLFIGNSAINRRILAFFRKKQMRNITLCTRAIGSAQSLLSEGPLRLIDWQNLSLWQEFPVVICGTNAAIYQTSDYLLTTFPLDRVQDVVQTRLVIDLCVPRNVDPRIGRHPQITLFNIEEIGGLIQTKEGKFLEEVQLCKEHLHFLVEKQLSIYHERSHVPSMA